MLLSNLQLQTIYSKKIVKPLKTFIFALPLIVFDCFWVVFGSFWVVFRWISGRFWVIYKSILGFFIGRFSVIFCIYHLPRSKFDRLLPNFDPLNQARNQGGVQGCRCTPLSSERRVQWRICPPPPSHIKEIVSHNFLKSSYQ